MNREDAIEHAVKELKYRRSAKTALETLLQSRKAIERELADVFTSHGLDAKWSAELANRCMNRIDKETRVLHEAVSAQANIDIDTLVKHNEESVDLADVG